MRRGLLAQQPLEEVLRHASEDDVTGAIEVESVVAGHVFLERGQVTYAQLLGAATPTALGIGADATADAIRRHVRDVVRALLPLRRGTFHLHPAHQLAPTLPQRSRIRYPVAELLADVAVDAGARRQLAAWEEDLLRVRAPAGRPDLGEDAWAALAGLCQPDSVHALASTLGWDGHRLDAALGELRRAGVLQGPGDLHPELGERGSADPIRLAPVDAGGRRRERSHLSPVDSSGPDRASAPDVAPGRTTGRRRALGRLIESLRT